MLPPVQRPSYRYPSTMIPALYNVPYWDGDLVIQEPELCVHAIPWNNASNAALSCAAAPELGDMFSGAKLGNQITVLVLCYGNYPDTHKRCLDSILSTVPMPRLDLRIAANCVGQASDNYLRTLPCTKLYTYDTNMFKYPIMRDMLYDESCPIVTPYFAWFDDNAYVKHNNWLNVLAQDILAQPLNVAMYGSKLYYTFELDKEDPRPWLKEQPWYKGRSLRTKTNAAAPGGSTIHFCNDWFFVMQYKAAKACGIPCKSLKQKGAIVIGEQLYQNGYSLKTFNLGKAFIYQPPYNLRLKRDGDKQFLPWQAAFA